MYTLSQEIGKSNNNKSLLGAKQYHTVETFQKPNEKNEDIGKIDRSIKHIPELHLPGFGTDTSVKRDELDYVGHSCKY